LHGWGECQVTQVDKLRSIEEYNALITLQLAELLTCDFVLIIQYDGFVIASDRWSADFFNFDYISAVSPEEEMYCVGAGGFSLRSRKLVQAVAELADERQNGEAEDLFICKRIRWQLEQHYGIIFAPSEVAQRFSQTVPSGQITFGFHGVFYLPSIYRGNPSYLVENLPKRITDEFLSDFRLGIQALSASERTAFEAELEQRRERESAQLPPLIKPLISFVIPTFKRPQKLERLLRSIQSATGFSREIVVVDDDPAGSGFNPCQEHGAVYLQKGNHTRGPGASRNIGAEHATGEWVCFVDDDDWFDSVSLSNLSEKLLQDQRGVLIHTDYVIETLDGAEKVTTNGVSRQDLLLCNRIAVGSFFIRRCELQSHFDENIASHEDWDFLLGVTQRLHLQHLPILLVHIDNRDQTMGSRSSNARSEFWKDYLGIYLRFKAPDLADRRGLVMRAIGCPQHLEDIVRLL
jgi:hypothetical protein